MDSMPSTKARVQTPGKQPANEQDGGGTEIPIPSPPETFLLGHFPLMDPSFPIRPLQQFAELYGEIYRLKLGAQNVMVVSTQALINELSDQDRFHKDLPRALREVRALTGDGLFTAAHEDGIVIKKEPNWWKAHRLLVPAFGPLGLRKMFDDMLDISAQMVLKWDRMGKEHAIECSDDFTRLAFDTIGLCSFGYRFNEFYTDDAHPFAKQMADVLKMSGQRANRPDAINKLHRWEEQERQENVKKMHQLCSDIVQDRKAHPMPDAKDLLNTMLYGVDRESGESLSEQNIVYNMVTFLVAGHETTSATLSFLWYNLLKNPTKFHKAQKQVDEVVGDSVLTLEMLPKLTYIDACIKETLRLNSPIAAFSVVPFKTTTLGGGKYRLNENDVITCNLKGLHHDPQAWGENHNEFEPERFLDGKFQKLPPNSWKPFGNGMRACIGRGFAEQEMIMNTAMLLQRFAPEMVDPSYDLKLKSTLTIKPDGFFMRVKRRPGKTLQTGIPGGVPSDIAQGQAHTEHSRAGGDAATAGTKVNIYYGGNAGTCEGFAQNLETRLQDFGVKATVSSLDSASENLSTDSVNAIITSSYEGKPPDNGKVFVAWLEQLQGSDKLKGVKYSVMGVGNSDWASTFHRIPKLVDERLQALGAKAILPAGYANVKTDLLGPFDDWAESFAKALMGKDSSSAEDEKPTLKVVVEKGKLAKQLGGEKMGEGIVLDNRQLADDSVGPAKMHLEVMLPEGVIYEAGDYLVILPKNPQDVVTRVMRFFGFADHTRISVQGSKKRYLPSEPTPIGVFLFGYVELQTPVTKRQLGTIASYAEGETKVALEKLQNDDIYASILEKRYSIIDILEEHPLEFPFEAYIDMLIPLVPRQYSISSSPLVPGQERTASVTYDIHTSPALSGHGVFFGVCSTFLASRKTGDRMSVMVRGTNVGFKLPGDTGTPIMMFAAGTGIAPMRAFIQERAVIHKAGGRKLGPALLFFGCRDAEKDFLYKDELKQWQEQGIVEVFGAHSRMPAGSTGPKYVQDAIWEQRERCSELFREGGKIYLCGSAARLGASCSKVVKDIYMEHSGKDEKQAEEWLDTVRTSRYISDVY